MHVCAKGGHNSHLLPCGTLFKRGLLFSFLCFPVVSPSLCPSISHLIPFIPSSLPPPPPPPPLPRHSHPRQLEVNACEITVPLFPCHYIVRVILGMTGFFRLVCSSQGNTRPPWYCLCPMRCSVLTPFVVVVDVVVEGNI